MTDKPPLLASFGDFQLDEGNARLRRGARSVELTPKAFAVLCTLVREAGRLVVKDALLDAVWGHRHVSESVLKTTISQLRNALADDARQPRFIETAARRGYRFIAAIETVQPAAGVADTAPGPEPDWDSAANESGLPEPLVGRGAPLAALHRSLGAALRGQRQVVLVAGEPGIGKTTLIDRFVQSLPGAQVVHAAGQCVEHHGAGEPYMPVLEAFNMLCRADADLPELMRKVAPTWLVQLPWYLGDDDRRQLQREVAGATPDRMLRECGELLDRFSAQRALLLVFEDLHWSDHATVQLIDYLARRRSVARLMLIGSFRPTDIIVGEHALAGVRQELRLHRLCHELDLEAFSEFEVGELIAARLDGQHAPEPFVRALHAHTEGLPLFVVNVLDELITVQALRRCGSSWSFPEAARLTVPRNIVGVVEKRIARLSEAQQLWLGAASAAGAEFVHAPLADALQVPADELQRCLDAAVARQQWLRCTGVTTLPDGRVAARYAFAHALYRHVLYQRQGPAQRVQWHRRIAVALRDAYGKDSVDVAAELAVHFERGEQFAAAIGQLIVVAGKALGRTAGQEALHCARHGLQLLSKVHDEGQRQAIELDLRVLEGVALSQLQVISAPEIGSAFDRARALCERVADSPAHARALHGLWWVTFARGDLDRARELAQRLLVLAQTGADASLLLAGSSAMGLTLAHRGELLDARRHLHAAIDVYVRIGDHLPPGMFVQDPGVEAMGYLAVLSWWTGEPRLARQFAHDAVALATRIRHPFSQLIAHDLTSVLHHFAGEVEPALRAAERVFELLAEHHLENFPGACTWVHGHAVAAMGDVDRGLAEMREGEQACRRVGLLIGLTGFEFTYAQACIAAGRNAEAWSAIERGLALAHAGNERALLSPLHRLRAHVSLQRGDLAGADASYRMALEVARAQGAPYFELAALLGCSSIANPPLEAVGKRLHELARIYQDESTPMIVAARSLLTHGARPAPAT
jgi:DNA-binding winged helix-turn-helix (wHTH) protein/tetratricopeptide (TPR) repeat protein